MTHAQRTMTDGELNRAVAEALGWRRVQAPKWDYDGKLPEQGEVLVPPGFDESTYVWPPKGVVAFDAFLRGAPRWSTDIAAAWTLVEKMRSEKWIVELEHNPYPESVCKLSRAKTPCPLTKLDWEGPLFATEPTMERAICLAYLAAKGAKPSTAPFASRRLRES